MRAIKRAASVIAAFVIAAAAAPAMAQIAPMSATLPSMKIGCVRAAIPSLRVTADEAEATEFDEKAAAVIEKARTSWTDLATAASIKQRGAVYVAMDLPPKDFTGTETPSEICAVVAGGSAVDGLTIKTVPGREGFVGFCRETDPEACMAKVFAALNFTDEHPWPRLPIYSLWRNEVTEPSNASDVLDYLSRASFDVASPQEVPGTTRSFDIDNLTACEGDACPAVADAIETTDGRGIAWFLPLSKAETPKPVTEEHSNGQRAVQ